MTNMDIEIYKLRLKAKNYLRILYLTIRYSLAIYKLNRKLYDFRILCKYNIGYYRFCNCFKSILSIFSVILILVLVSTGSLAAEKEVISFHETGEGTASKFERPVDAERRAEEDALNKALKNSGIDVQGVFQDFMSESSGKNKYSVIENYVFLWTNSIVDYKKEGEAVFENLADGAVKCRLSLKGKVISKGKKDPLFEIKFEDENRQLGLNQPEYYDGDDFAVSFKSTKDSYVQIIVVDEDKNAFLVSPNRYDKTEIARGGEVFSIPDEKTGETGVLLKTGLPENKKETHEFLHIILTKNQPLYNAYDAGADMNIGSVSDVFKRLAKLDRSQWTMAILPYGIKEK